MMAAPREIRVKLTLDTTAFEAAMRRAARAMNELGAATTAARHKFRRMHDTPGDRHIERVMREIATGVPGRDPVARLIAASDFAAILDRSHTA